MAKDTYTYKEILLGLRDEFIDIESKLDELKDYSLANEKYVSSYHYHLSKTSDEYLPELRVHVVRKETELMRRLRELLRKYTYYSNPTSALMVKNNNGIYYPLAGKPFKLGVNPQYKEEFERLATELLNSRFANEMNFGKIASTSDAQDGILAISRLEPQLKLRRDKKVALVNYLGRTDGIKYSATPGLLLTQELLDDLMSIEFPKEKFSPYHQELIENASDRERPILLSADYKPTAYGEFKIIDYGSNNNIYLKKRKSTQK